MPVDVTETLRKALHQLEEEKTKLESRIAAVRAALDGVPRRKATAGARAGAPQGGRRRRRLSAAARRAVSRRMKTYWAKRKAAAGKRQAEASAKGKASSAKAKKRG